MAQGPAVAQLDDRSKADECPQMMAHGLMRHPERERGFVLPTTRLGDDDVVRRQLGRREPVDDTRVGHGVLCVVQDGDEGRATSSGLPSNLEKVALAAFSGKTMAVFSTNPASSTVPSVGT
jgi:hypothetical protein